MATDFLRSLNQAIASNNQRDKEQAERSRYAPLFRMPEVAESDGTRRTLIRFITPFDNGVIVLCHESFGKFRTVCPKLYGKDCQYCKMTADQQKSKSITTKEYYGWQVWNYRGGREGKGQAQLFIYTVNKASPIPPIVNVINEEIRSAKEDGRSAHDVTDFDIILTQNGEEAKRSFNALPKAPKAFNILVLPWSQEFMRDSWTYIISPESRELLGEAAMQNAVLQQEDEDVDDEKNDLSSLLDTE